MWISIKFHEIHKIQWPFILVGKILILKENITLNILLKTLMTLFGYKFKTKSSYQKMIIYI